MGQVLAPLLYYIMIYHILNSTVLFVSVKGLGVIPGTVGRFDSSAGGIRVPHIGWNALQVGNDSDILDDVGNRHVYFVHSYRAIPVLISIISSFLYCFLFIILFFFGFAVK